MTTASLPRAPDTAKLVCFGNGGDVVHIGRGHTVSGYGTPERPHAARTRDDITYPDGTPVIDKRPAIDTDEGYRWVFRGPMVNVNLADDECDRCPKPSPLFAAAVAGNAYGTLLAGQATSRAKGEQRGPLDDVSTAEYIDGWRKVGARVGHYRDGAIVWDTEALAITDAQGGAE